MRDTFFYSILHSRDFGVVACEFEVGFKKKFQEVNPKWVTMNSFRVTEYKHSFSATS